MSVVISTYLLSRRGNLQNIRDVERYKGPKEYVRGVVAISIHGAVIISEQDSDDIDWLWPFLVQATEECRNTGAGERFFGDSPLLFRVERLPTGRLLVSLRIGEQRRAATTDAGEFYRALAAAGLEFFAFSHRHIRGSGDDGEPKLLRSWLEER